MRKPEGLAGQKCLREDTKDGIQNKMRQEDHGQNHRGVRS